MKKVVKILVTLGVAVSGLVLVEACTESQGKGSSIPKNTEPIPVKVIALEKTSSEHEVITSGRLTTDDETIMSFKTGGVVNEIFVKEGDKIRKGQVLATLDLTEINALVAQANAGLEKAARDLARAKNLYADSVATLEQLQNVETSYDLAEQQFKAAKFNRNYSQIKAMVDGFVLKKFVNAGQVVGIGDPVLQTNGAANGKWILKTGVNDLEWASVKLSDKAEIKVDAFPGKKFEGIVTRKSETADPSTGSFTIEIAVIGKSKFATGMFASAKIISADKAQLWSVPYEAVLDANDNEGFVFVTNDNRNAVKKPVIIDSFNGSSIRISAGLEDAKSIIVSGSAYLTDHSPIAVVQ